MSTADLSIVATAIVGVVGIAAAALTAWGRRTHAERLARQSFLRTRRGDVYTEVLTAVRRITRGIELEGMLIQPAGGNSPSPLEDEVIFHLDALMAVYGSKSKCATSSFPGRTHAGVSGRKRRKLNGQRAASRTRHRPCLD